ncbi:uncharacterized protein KY384_004181 [Bacidia gigantensis]|uniref:uncharacterized protein n=1 Tax=Bacidia gigantensis TaxID=2732470 RepID=UPI001D055CFD|nr:uncharacterized protein KY384_004181 [Bacidia gigantensis]KAG8530824.1 hypothetical protein KY384_004181 [Bacidia gigantensis]
MSTLNLSSNGPSISKSYQSVVDATLPTGAAAKSTTYGIWAVFSVSAPLANAFQQDSAGKESVLKVQSTGEGELVDLVDEFSDGRIQFAFVKIKDPNTTLPKSVLIAWCGEGVPERTKGYFTNHLTAVSKTLHGYHVQITARSDRDLTPESIVQKVSDASGSKYSGATSTPAPPPAPIASKPVFTPTQSSAGGNGFNPLASRSRSGGTRDQNVDEDGWGADAPPVTRRQLEKVQPSYQPTKMNIQDLQSQHQSSRGNDAPIARASEDSSVVKGAYQPIGKVDISEIRRQAQRSTQDDRPIAVKGSYEPVGKVDIAAIRARAQPSTADAPSPPRSSEPRQSLPDRTAPFNTSERLTSLPKPKVGGQFGSSTSSFTGTKAPTPGVFGLESKSTGPTPPVGVGKNFADQGGKTPAQLWAEKKARERGLSGAGENPPPAGLSQAPVVGQNSGGGEWKSGYTGKKWGAVHTSKSGESAGSMGEQRTGSQADEEDTSTTSPVGGVSAMRDKFKNAAPIGAANVGTGIAATPPALDVSSKPNAGRGIPIPGMPSRSEAQGPEEPARLPSPPPQPPRSPTPPTPPPVSGSPIRIAMPVGRGHNDQEVIDARDEQLSPPPQCQPVPHEDDLLDEPQGHDVARGAGVAAAAASFGEEAVESAQPGAEQSGKRALVQYDYEKAEENELELKEGEHVTNIEMVDENWWMGQNPRGESGLFPSNYVELIEDDSKVAPPAQQHEVERVAETSATSQGATATALYDYEAAEENELTFPENAKITGIEFPDDDWWSGEYAGKAGLFPANYVQLDE